MWVGEGEEGATGPSRSRAGRALPSVSSCGHFAESDGKPLGGFYARLSHDQVSIQKTSPALAPRWRSLQAVTRRTGSTLIQAKQTVAGPRVAAVEEKRGV